MTVFSKDLKSLTRKERAIIGMRECLNVHRLRIIKNS